MNQSQIDTSRVVCRFDELLDPGSRAFTMGSGEWPLRGFVVRRGAAVFGYLNRCPHAGHPLNFSPDDFFSPERTLLMCRSHGARFDISTGLCVAGPCAGAHLRSIAVSIEHGYIMLTDDPDVLATQYA
jgi:nitrite reductase/ring-hydroxylating ferredoxin subunit